MRCWRSVQWRVVSSSAFRRSRMARAFSAPWAYGANDTIPKSTITTRSRIEAPHSSLAAVGLSALRVPPCPVVR